MAVERYKNGMSKRQYLNYQNKNPFYNPVLSNGEMLKDKMISSTKGLYGGTHNFSFIEYDNKLKCFVAHIYGVKTYKNQNPKVEEVMRIAEDYDTISKNCYYENYGMGAGFHVIYSKKGITRNWYGYYPYEKEFQFNNEVENYWKVYAREILNIDELIACDESIKYCAYKENQDIYFIQYIRLYRNYPIAEMLMKLGLTRMIHEKALKVISENKEFRCYLFDNAEDLSRHRFAFITAYNAFKKKSQSAVDYMNSLLYRIQAGKEIAFENKEVYKEILRFTTQEKILKYLNDNEIGKSSYADYIVACKWLKLDFADTKVLFPKNFEEVHDKYIEMYDAYKRELEKEKSKHKDKFIKAVADKYSFLEYSNGTYQVITAKSKGDLIDEGAALKHCVGRMDYDQRQIEEQSIICFIRKCEEPNKPFVTCELSLTDPFKIKQCYGLKNNLVDEIEPFKNEWLEYAKKTYKTLKRKKEIKNDISK